MAVSSVCRRPHFGGVLSPSTQSTSSSALCVCLFVCFFFAKIACKLCEIVNEHEFALSSQCNSVHFVLIINCLAHFNSQLTGTTVYRRHPEEETEGDTVELSWRWTATTRSREGIKQFGIGFTPFFLPYLLSPFVKIFPTLVFDCSAASMAIGISSTTATASDSQPQRHFPDTSVG